MGWPDPQELLSTYLKFDNAALFWIAGSSFIMLMLLLRRQIFRAGSWAARGEAANVTIALGMVCFGVALRAGSIYMWRMGGAPALGFPYLRAAAGDFCIILGMLSAMALSWAGNGVNWPWRAALAAGVVFGLTSLLV